MVAATGAFTAVRDHPDLAGRPRFVTAVRRVRLWQDCPVTDIAEAAEPEAYRRFDCTDPAGPGDRRGGGGRPGRD